MSTVTPIGVTRWADFTMDREQAADDEAQFQKEQRSHLIAQRGDEILAKRCANLSDEDLALAFETLSTYSICLATINSSMKARHCHFAETLEILVRGALVPDSIRQAREEFASLDAIKTGEVH